MLVFHVDANSAYLSWTAVNLLEKGFGKDIRDIPSAIAGNPKNRHGIILAKSIPAGKYGIKTGESLFEAKQKCPELEVYPPDYDLFILCSNGMYDILAEYTPIIQRYSIDECFLDVSRSRRICEDPVKAAYEIKDRIKEELGFTVNVGIGSSKLCAKMAGELEKPDKVNTLWDDEVPLKLWPLPAGELFMVGRATVRKLEKINIRTVGEIAAANPLLLKDLMKSHGELIYRYAHGIDHSEVIVNSSIVQKGVGNSMTFSYDIETAEELYRKALALCERVGMRLRRLGNRASLVAVYLKYSSFSGYRHQVQLHSRIQTTTEIYEIARGLIDDSWRGQPVRQMGVSVSDLSSNNEVQLTLFDRDQREQEEKLAVTIDTIRQRYGERSLIRGCFANSPENPVEGGVNNGNYIMMGGYKS